MANQCNLLLLPVYGLSANPAMVQNHPNAVAFWRQAIPQPFNASGVFGGGRPTSGQIWPRGNV